MRALNSNYKRVKSRVIRYWRISTVAKKRVMRGAHNPGMAVLRAWENSLHFPTPPLVSYRNDVWGQASANSILMWRVITQICFDWLKQRSHVTRQITGRSTIQFWVITRHQYGISQCSLESVITTWNPAALNSLSEKYNVHSYLCFFFLVTTSIPQFKHFLIVLVIVNIYGVVFCFWCLPASCNR